MVTKKYFIAFLLTLFAVPVMALLMDVKLSETINSLVDSSLAFIPMVAGQTYFEESATTYLLLVLLGLPFQVMAIGFYVWGLPLGNFERLAKLLTKNDPVIRLGRLVLLRQKWGLGIACIGLFLLTIFVMFRVGGDIYLCQGCSGSSKFGFVTINTLQLFSLHVYAVVFSAWFRATFNKD